MVFDDFFFAKICQKESDNETGQHSNSTTSEMEGIAYLMKNEDSDSDKRREKHKQVHMNHAPTDVISDINDGRETRGIQLTFREMVQFACFASII